MSVAEPLSINKPNVSERPDPFSGLRQSVAGAKRSSLEQTLLRIVDILPHTYLLASCSLRVDSKEGQELIDAIEIILANMIDLTKDFNADWNLVTEALQSQFAICKIRPSDTIAVIEFAMGRILLFARIFHQVENLTPTFEYLKDLHLFLLKADDCPDTSYLPELAVNWLSHCHSQLVDEWFDGYIESLDEAGLRNIGDVAGGAWIAAVLSDQETKDDRESLLFETLQKVSKKTDLSEAVRTFIWSDLADLDDYCEASEIMDELGQDAESLKLANAAVEKFGSEAYEIFLPYFVDEHRKNGDFARAAEEYLRVIKLEPSMWLHNKYVEFIDKYSASLPTQLWLERARDVVRERICNCECANRVEINTVLIELEILCGNLPKALQLFSEGCKSSSLIALLKSKAGLAQSYGQIFEVVSKQVESELGRQSEKDEVAVQELLMLLFKRADSTTEQTNFKAYLKDLKGRFNLKGKSAHVLRRFGV